MKRSIRLRYAAAVLALSLVISGAVRAQTPDPMGKRPAATWEYIYAFGAKMRMFFNVRNQLKLVVIGDSRGNQAVDPRGFYADDTRENKDLPSAFNLGEGGCGFDVHEILFNEYVADLPKLEWVVYQMSPRLFNTYYQDTGIEKFNASPGLRYDREHAKEIMSYKPERPFLVSDIKPGHPQFRRRKKDIRDKGAFGEQLAREGAKGVPGPYRSLWKALTPEARAVLQTDPGKPPAEEDWPKVFDALNAALDKPDLFDDGTLAGLTLADQAKALLKKGRASWTPGDVQVFNRQCIEALFPLDVSKMIPTFIAWGWHEPLKGRTDPAHKQEFIADATLGRYEIETGRWARFERILDNLAARNVKVLAFVCPMHYSLAEASCADDDGTSDAAYWALMSSLRELQQAHRNFHFVDMHKDGRNDLADEEYFNWDHVNYKGAEKLTRRLEALRQGIAAQPKPDMIPPAVMSVTAIGNPGRVTVAFTEPVRSAAANAGNFTISRGVKVSGAVLDAKKSILVLTTTRLREGEPYELTLNNVADNFDNALVSSQARFTYVAALRLTIPSRQGCAWGKIAAGGPLYADRPDPCVEAPAALAGLDLLRTVAADQASRDDKFLSFQANCGVRVYVAHDEKNAMKPAWLDSFVFTWDFIKVGNDRLRLAWKDFPDGKVTLGGNSGPEGRMYVVVVEPRGIILAGRRDQGQQEAP